MKAEVHVPTRGRKPIRVVSLLFLSFLSGISNSSAHDEWYWGLDLEPALGEACLVMVARVADVSETRILFGSKAERRLREFKFTPEQVLKGVFSRESLSLTSEDLGIGNYSDATAIEPGQLRLLMLGRSDRGYAIFRVSPNLEQAIPPLRDLRPKCRSERSNAQGTEQVRYRPSGNN
jgi:hypothetical protein